MKYQTSFRTSLIDSRSQRMFSIDGVTGDISTVSDIDREFMSVHYFKVTGISDDIEAGGERLTATTTLQISVKDVNDNAPHFEQQVYNSSVRESLPIGSSIVTVRASDTDADDNGRVSYTLTGDDKNLFRIDSTSGALSLRANLDRETKIRHVIGVTARDNSVPATQRLTSNATVIINLIDDNDNVPAFTRRIYYLDVREDVSVTDKPLVGSVMASDLDDGENALIKYSIIGGNTGGAFSINHEGGQIFLQKGLDREKQGKRFVYFYFTWRKDVGAVIVISFCFTKFATASYSM
jgi:cadherin EGF LAG seven-pass G-type receptor 1